jgi:FkbM family methyltransferase
VGKGWQAIKSLFFLSAVLIDDTNLPNPILEMTQHSTANPENGEQNLTPTALKTLLGWLSQRFPELSVTLYDIGARHGVHYHYRDLLQLSQFKVVGFEPDAQEADRLQTTQSDFQRIYPFAIGKTKETRTIYITRHPGCSSLFPPNQALLAEYPPIAMFEVVNRAEVPTISLDEFVQTHQPPLPDFLKIDTQGAEGDILAGAATVLEGVVGVFLEAHLREMYLGTALFPEIHQLLKDAGFRLVFCQNNPNYAGEILELDVAYVRDVTSLPTLEKLLSAVLFCVVHNNLEFAGHLVRRSTLLAAAKTELLALLGQPTSPPAWIQSEDGRFHRQTDHDHHQESQSVNVGTIQEQWL